MNLPRGTLENIEKWERARPMDFLAKADLHFSGVIRFFERGPEWNVFFLLFEKGCLIAYYTTRGDASLEEKLHAVIEGFEVEVRSFTPAEMEIARTLNDQYLFAKPKNISEMIKGEVEAEPQVRGLFPDASILAEIKRARQFRENFQRRRIEGKD